MQYRRPVRLRDIRYQHCTGRSTASRGHPCLVSPARVSQFDKSVIVAKLRATRLRQRRVKKVEQRVGGTSDKVVDKTFDKAEDTVNCAAGDEECARRATAGGQNVAATPPAATASAKCIATDVGCLKQAKARGQTVEIVSEEEVDTLYCASSDTKCLQRAQKLHKKVEITD